MPNALYGRERPSIARTICCVQEIRPSRFEANQFCQRAMSPAIDVAKQQTVIAPEGPTVGEHSTRTR